MGPLQTLLTGPMSDATNEYHLRSNCYPCISKLVHLICRIPTQSGRNYGASVAQLSKRRPPTTEIWVRSLYRASDRTWEEFVNTLPKVVGFLRVLRFPPTGKVDWVG